MKIITNKFPANTSSLPYVRHKGAALLMTLAVLVILTTIVYSMVSRLSIYKRRQQYMINYQTARYACDSALKYALTKAKDIEPELITRKDLVDFSDLFYMTYQQEQEMLQQWAEIKTEELLEAQLNAEQLDEDEEGPVAPIMESLDIMRSSEGMNSFGSDDPMADMGSLSSILPMGGFGDPNSGSGGFLGSNSTPTTRDDGSIDPNSLRIPGPYGVDWPYITKPMEFKIGSAKVTIKIRDENAKMPLTWGLMNDKGQLRAANDAVVTFCQWMQMDEENIERLMLQLEEVKKQKPFSKTMKPVVTYKKTKQTIKKPTRTSRSSQYRRKAIRPTPSTRTVTKKITRPNAGHSSDFARLLHSSLIDTDTLSTPLPDTGDRYESALKYLALWGTQKVNINTAPRHVLEAAFIFGGQQEDIADAIIQQRFVKPYKDIEDFKRQNYGFADSIRKVQPYIVTKSSFFAIEVTAACGNAIVTSVTTVKIENKKVERIAIMSN